MTQRPHGPPEQPPLSKLGIGPYLVLISTNPDLTGIPPGNRPAVLMAAGGISLRPRQIPGLNTEKRLALVQRLPRGSGSFAGR